MGFFLRVDARFVYLHWCKWCTYFLRFHSVLLLWVVNKSVCLNDERKMTVWKWKRMPRRDIIFRTTKHWHILQPTLSMSHSEGGGGGGVNQTYLSILAGRKDYTHKKAIYLKNHWIISVPRNTSLVYHTFMWIKLIVWVIIELNKSKCAVHKIRVVQQCQPPK